MSAPPYMNVYVADYTADVQALSCEQDGAYWRLLRSMWRAGGKLPNTPQKLANITGLSLERWLEISPDVLALFVRRGGSLTHKRITSELDKIATKSDVRSEAGKRGAAKKANKHKDKAEAFASDLLKQNASISELDIREETPVAPKGAKAISLRKAHVEAAWSATPPTARARTSRSDIESALKAAARRGHEPEEVIDGLKAYYRTAEATREDGRFAKGAHRIIAGDRWKDFAETPIEQAAAKADPNDVWRRRITAFRTGSGYWNTNDWGGKPGHDGCMAPASVLLEFGIGGAEIVPFPREERAA